MAKFTQQINETNTDYEPTVADRIQRVLYRLDHGEQLTHNTLKSDDNFGIMLKRSSKLITVRRVLLLLLLLVAI